MGELEYSRLRELMVNGQLIARGIHDGDVLRAMLDIPRHLFVPQSVRDRAYDDCALPLTCGQTISQPYMVALMTELLELSGKERVLEVGTGSGYQAAVLSVLCREVHTIERIAELSLQARDIVRQAGFNNIHFHVGDGTLGIPQEAPFDRIIVTAGAPEVPEALRNQLADGGIIIAPTGSRQSQVLLKITRHADKFMTSNHTGCVFVPLIGEQGWPRDAG